MRRHSSKFDYLIGITGASGAIYAHRLIEELAARGYNIGIIFSGAGRQVYNYELKLVPQGDWSEFICKRYGSKQISVYDNDSLFAAAASGSSIAKAMIVVPTSMGTLSRIAHGVSSCLLERSADVYIKEQQPLLLVPRETPLSAIHLENMLKLSRLGVKIIAAMPGFYYHPEGLSDQVNFIVGKILDALDLEHNLYPGWEEALIENEL